MPNPNRRTFLSSAAAGAALLAAARTSGGDGREPQSPLRYILASSMYGRLPLQDVLAEVAATGSQAIDIWPEPHANHREQIEQMGEERFGELLDEHQVQVGIYTCYNPGLFEMQPQMRTLKQLGGRMVIANSRGPKDLQGAKLKEAVRDLVRRLQPQRKLARELGLVIGVENHSGGLINSPDSLRWLAEYADGAELGIALAPYHLPQDEQLMAGLIRDLGDKLVHFYAWQHGDGSGKLPKQQEMRQMAGRGPLNFTPLVEALREIHYDGWTSVFMHPFPRGVPILPTAEEVTAAINQSREYLEQCLEKTR